MSRSSPRERGAWALGAGLALAVAVSLPPSAPGVLFWGAVLLACACAARWSWLTG